MKPTPLNNVIHVRFSGPPLAPSENPDLMKLLAPIKYGPYTRAVRRITKILNERKRPHHG